MKQEDVTPSKGVKRHTSYLIRELHVVPASCGFEGGGHLFYTDAKSCPTEHVVGKRGGDAM